MKRSNILILASVILAMATSCYHKDLCYNHQEHALRYHVNIIASYRCEWEENCGGPDLKKQWPEDYIPYDDLRPQEPDGLRVVTYNVTGESNIHNISAHGGVVTLYGGANDILLYNNDTEYILFTRHDNSATTRATTRTRTRASFTQSKYANDGEETVNPPDMLYSNFIGGYQAEKLLEPEDLPVTLHPLVFTYKIRYEFEEGLQYVSMARGALTGMARSVLMNTGTTSEEGATLLYDCNVTDYGANAIVKSFGVPGYPNANYVKSSAGRKHALNLEVLLRNGKMMTFEFDVTDQVKAQPHGGVIIVKGIKIQEEDGSQGTGAFDVSVNGWGEYEDIVLPL